MLNLGLIFCFWSANDVFLDGEEDGGEAGETYGSLISVDPDVLLCET